MISSSAREAFEFFTQQALKGALAASPDDRCDVSVVEDLSRIKGQRIVLLTVSHFLLNSSSDFPAAVHSDFAVLSSLLQAAISACV